MEPYQTSQGEQLCTESALCVGLHAAEPSALAILENVAGLYREHPDFCCLLLSTIDAMLGSRGAKLYDIHQPQDSPRIASEPRKAVHRRGEAFLQSECNGMARRNGNEASERVLGRSRVKEERKSRAHNLRKGLSDVVKAGGDAEKESRPFLNAVFWFLGLAN